MINYPKMYAIVCAAASEALDKLPEIEANAQGRHILQNALFEAEELYIQCDETEQECD